MTKSENYHTKTIIKEIDTFIHKKKKYKKKTKLKPLNINLVRLNLKIEN